MATIKFKSKRAKSVDPNWEFIQNNLTVGLELRRSYETQWILNMAFLAGKQWSFYNTSTSTLHEVRAVPGQQLIVDNIILPKWKRQVSNLIKSRPRISIVPNSSQEEDIAAAKLGAKALDYYFTNNFMKRKSRELSIWIYTTGNAFLTDFWNPRKGLMGMNKKTGKVEYSGDVDCDVWGPFDVVLPMYADATNINQLDWFMLRHRKSLEWIKDNLKGGENVEEEDISKNYVSVDMFRNKALGLAAIGRIPSAYFITMYVKPCKKFPKGAFFRASNGVVEPRQDWPFEEYPIEHFKDLEYPNELMGDATMTHAVPLQIRWNKCASSIAEFNEEVAKMKIAVPRQANLEVTPSGHHRELLYYKPVLGHKPEFMTPYSLSPSVEQERMDIMMSMENLFSQHEVSRGTNRSDIRSGDMVELLLEQDAHGEIPSHSIYEEGYEQHGKRILLRMQQGYTTERIVKVGDTEDTFEVLSFQGSDLRNNRDVKVVKSSSLPDSPAARNMRVERRFQMGLLGDPADPKTRRRVLRMLDDSIVDDIYSEYKKDENLAQWENRVMMSTRKPLVVNSYDNHAVHVDEHQRIRKSVRFQKIKVENPQVFMEYDYLIEVHCQQHQMFIQEEMKKQMQLMQAQGGGVR